MILNRIEPGDDNEINNRYTRAKRCPEGSWLTEGALFTEPDPAIYVYHQEFTHEGVTYTRRGFMARMRLSRFGEGQVFPHEETMPGPKIDRLMLMTTCKANLSQIFGLYPDSAGDAQRILDEAASRITPVVGDRPSGRREPHVGGDRRRGHRGRGRGLGLQARLHRRRTPPLRDGLPVS